jgi:hypothetical protein
MPDLWELKNNFTVKPTQGTCYKVEATLVATGPRDEDSKLVKQTITIERFRAVLEGFEGLCSKQLDMKVHSGSVIEYRLKVTFNNIKSSDLLPLLDSPYASMEKWKLISDQPKLPGF